MICGACIRRGVVAQVGMLPSRVSTSHLYYTLYRYAHIGNHIATSGHLLPTKHLRRPSHAACGKFLSEFDRAGNMLLISLELNTLE